MQCCEVGKVCVCDGGFVVVYLFIVWMLCEIMCVCCEVFVYQIDVFIGSYIVDFGGDCFQFFFGFGENCDCYMMIIKVELFGFQIVECVDQFFCERNCVIIVGFYKVLLMFDLIGYDVVVNWCEGMCDYYVDGKVQFIEYGVVGFGWVSFDCKIGVKLFVCCFIVECKVVFLKCDVGVGYIFGNDVKL